MSEPTDAAVMAQKLLDGAWLDGTPEDVKQGYRDRIAAALRQAKREALEEAAKYIETHYPVFVTGDGPSRWQMDPDQDGGRIQREYVAAVRALIQKGESK